MIGEDEVDSVMKKFYYDDFVERPLLAEKCEPDEFEPEASCDPANAVVAFGRADASQERSVFFTRQGGDRWGGTFATKDIALENLYETVESKNTNVRRS